MRLTSNFIVLAVTLTSVMMSAVSALPVKGGNQPKTTRPSLKVANPARGSRPSGAAAGRTVPSAKAAVLFKTPASAKSTPASRPNLAKSVTSPKGPASRSHKKKNGLARRHYDYYPWNSDTSGCDSYDCDTDSSFYYPDDCDSYDCIIVSGSSYPDDCDSYDCIITSDSSYTYHCDSDDCSISTSSYTHECDTYDCITGTSSYVPPTCDSYDCDTGISSYIPSTWDSYDCDSDYDCDVGSGWS